MTDYVVQVPLEEATAILSGSRSQLLLVDRVELGATIVFQVDRDGLERVGHATVVDRRIVQDRGHGDPWRYRVWLSGPVLWPFEPVTSGDFQPIPVGEAVAL